MTKEEMLYELDARNELPECFSPEERKKYADTMERAYDKVRDVDPFPPGTEVEVVNDFDLLDGDGRGAHLIGHTAIIKGNYQFECGGTGFGPTPDIFHPRAMTSSEMQAFDGFIPNHLSSMLEYSIITDVPGASMKWWPHKAFKMKVSPSPSLTVGKLLEIGKAKMEYMRKHDGERAFNRAISCISGMRLTAQQIGAMRRVLMDAEIANEIE